MITFLTAGALEQVREREPESPRRINARVDRDLETICLKCLAKEAGRRYESAQALAEDLERWMGGEPIRARRSSLWERVWCWCRRNPVIAALSASLMLLVFLTLAGLATGTWLLWRERGQTQEALSQAQAHAKRAEDQRRRAEANFGKALDGMTMLLEHLEDREWPQPLEIGQVQQSLLRQIEAYFQSFLPGHDDYESFSRWRSGRSSGGGQVDPVTRLEVGWAYQHLGVFYTRRGDAARAEQCYRTALGFHEGVVAEDPGDPAHIGMYAQSLDRLGCLLHVTGRREEAHDYFLRAGVQYRRQLQMHPDWRAYHALAWFLVTCPDERVRDAAEALHAASCAVELAPELLMCRGTLGRAQYRAGDWRAAAATLENCLHSREGEKSYDCFSRADCFFLAMTYWQLGDREQARRCFDRGLHPIGHDRGPYVSVEPIRMEAAALLEIPEQGASKPKEVSLRKE